MDKLILKFMWKFRGPRIDKTVLKKTIVGRLTFPNSKIYYKCYGKRNGMVLVQEDIQNNGIESKK